MTTPAIVALLATILLGIVVGLLYLQRVRRKALVTAHLVAALASVALVLLAVATAPARTAGPHWIWPVALVAGSTALGYSAFRYMRGRTRSELTLVAHVFTGVASFLVLLAFARTP